MSRRSAWDLQAVVNPIQIGREYCIVLKGTASGIQLPLN